MLPSMMVALVFPRSLLPLRNRVLLHRVHAFIDEHPRDPTLDRTAHGRATAPRHPDSRSLRNMREVMIVSPHIRQF